VSQSSQRAKLAIFGVGQISDMVSYYFAKINRDIECFIVDDKSISSDIFLNRPIFQIDDFLSGYNPEKVDAFVAISYHEQNTWREKYFGILGKAGFQFTSYISEHAYVENDVIWGENCLILEGSVIQKTCKIKNNSFIWTGVHIGHHSVIEENSFIGSSAVLMGCNIVGRNAHISANVTIKDHLEVSENSYLEPGKVVLE